ncbi:MAG: CHAT domain-containing tetratricopeptide repeat protein, partial [Acidobacteriota bacterium]
PPGDAPALQVDSWAQSWGEEFLCAVAETGGEYRIHLRSGGIAPRGRFRLRAAVRAATPDDRRCAEATRAHAEAFALASTARPVEAVARAFEEAAELWRRLGAPYPEALLWQRLAALHKGRGDVRSEVASLTAALQRLEDGAERAVERAQLTADLSLAHLRGGDVASAEAVAVRGVVTAMAEGNPVAGAFARLGRAQVLQVKGEPFAAADDLEAALEVFEGRGVLGKQADILTRHAVLYGEELGLFEEAIDLADAARALWRQLGDVESRATALIAKGWALFRLGELPAAVSTYDAALTLNGGRGAVGLAALDRKGRALLELGELEAAEAAFRAALALTPETDRRNRGQTLANLGWLRIEGGRWHEARAELTQAFELLEASGDLDALAHIRVGLGRCDRALGDLDGALDHFTVARGHLDALRRAAFESGGRMPVDPVWQSYADESIDLLVELAERSRSQDDLAAAFEAAELARARNFLSILLESDIEPRVHAPKDLVDEEQRLNAAYDALDLRRQSLDARPTPPARELAKVKRRQRQVQLRLESLRRQIRLSHPRFAELAAPDRPDLRGIQRSIPPDARILAYVLGPRRSFLFLVGPSSLELFELPARAQIDDGVRRARAGLSSRGGPADEQRALVLRQLGDTLLGGAAPELDGVEHLIVVASGELGLLPFAPLPLPADPTDEPAGARFALSYFPSAATIDVLDARKRAAAGTERSLVLVADPVFDRSDPRLVERFGGADTPAAGVGRLEDTLREARGITELFPQGRAVAVTGFEARRDWALSGALAPYSIVHFATHAEINNELPGSSRIILSGFDRDGRAIPPDLRLTDIYTLDLSADLVVLSACQSALGQRIEGNGLVGLARGFFYAGAGRLVVSLWDVDDAATATLMIDFYRSLVRDRASPAEALRRAQEHLRTETPWTHPYYWAGFIVQGPGW